MNHVSRGQNENPLVGTMVVDGIERIVYKIRPVETWEMTKNGPRRYMGPAIDIVDMGFKGRTTELYLEHSQ
mgnify:FL=1